MKQLTFTTEQADMLRAVSNAVNMQWNGNVENTIAIIVAFKDKIHDEYLNYDIHEAERVIPVLETLTEIYNAAIAYKEACDSELQKCLEKIAELVNY